MPRRPTYKELSNTVQSLLKRVKDLEQIATQNQELIKENRLLKERLLKYENQKNSRNSSLPPSKDENRPRPNQSLRRPSGKKSGGQLGRKGKTLEMVSKPDTIVNLHPDYCITCGADLSAESAVLENVRQKVDIPPIKALYTEYRSYSRVCDCGCKTVADFPNNVNAPVSYGEHIEALIGYFHARQYIPFARMKEVFNDVFSVPISEGGIHYLLNKFAEKTTPVYQEIKQRIANSPVVGSDETSVNINGKNQWLWTWQSPNLTYIAHSNNRASRTIETQFPKGFPNTVLVHDGWKPQLNTPAKNYQHCLAHLQRRLNYLNQKYAQSTWGKQFLKLLYDALSLKKTMLPKDYTHNTPVLSKAQVKRAQIVQTMVALLKNPPDQKYKELYSFYKRMPRERQHLFTFLYLPKVPPDNNASERAIRNVKVKQKISGQFKIEKTAQNFAKIRSVIDTTIKNGLNVLQSLTIIAKFGREFETD